jgi:membrane-associated PAP2 superfamily phosphatase
MQILGLTYHSKVVLTDTPIDQYRGTIRAVLLIALLFSLLNEYWGVDRKLADSIYLAGGHSWAWQNNFWLQKIIHNGGRSCSIGLELIILAFYLLSFLNAELKKNRKILVYLLVSVIISTCLVSLLKHALHLSCPWEFSIYGGDLDYLSRFSQLWLANGEGCFPAGHASAGYTWICLFFVGVHFKSRWRWLGLFIPLIVGLVFGFAQQLRGAHFISDDVWTLTLCWVTAAWLYRNMRMSDQNEIQRNVKISQGSY